jgi:hypothetical protein
VLKSKYIEFKRRNEKMKLFYDGLLVGQIMTNRSLTVEEALDLVDFDYFLKKNGISSDEIDPNEFYFED